MGKTPSFQFYPGDWFREPGLKRVDLAVRGAWAELLMIMWDETPQGRIETHVKGFAQTLRVDVPEACYIIAELDRNKIADVTYPDDSSREALMACADSFRGMSPPVPDLSRICPVIVSVVSRRMYRDWKRKENERLKKQRQRRRPSCPAGVPEKSGASSFSYNGVNKPISPNSITNNCKKPASLDKHREIFSEINVVAQKLARKSNGSRRFNPWAWIQKKINEDPDLHPQALHDALSGVLSYWGTLKKSPWAYADTIFKTRNQNYREQERIGEGLNTRRELDAFLQTEEGSKVAALLEAAL